MSVHCMGYLVIQVVEQLKWVYQPVPVEQVYYFKFQIKILRFFRTVRPCPPSGSWTGLFIYLTQVAENRKNWQHSDNYRNQAFPSPTFRSENVQHNRPKGLGRESLKALLPVVRNLELLKLSQFTPTFGEVFRDF